MKFIRKCPLFVILLSTGLLFTIIAVGGKQTIYAMQDYSPWKAPILSVMFTALNDDIYPWQILDENSVPVGDFVMEPDMQEASAEGELPLVPGASEELSASSEASLDASDGNHSMGGGEVLPAQIPSLNENADAGDGAEEEDGTPDQISQGEGHAGEASQSGNSQGENPQSANSQENNENMADIPSGRLEPLRESTYEEYINHISADIYGDAGVIRASAYEFAQVDESYFDDALFIGDSRTVGLRDYTDLSEHADFYCETSLTIYKVLEENFKGLGTIPAALAAKDYGKIYIMVGINELGRGTTENYMEKYTEVVDTLRELEPGAKIFIQGVMRVSGKKSSEDAIFNNSNINARNNAVATLADNENIFYIDVNEVICDEEGNLNADYTFDQIHLLGVYDEVWKQFLLEHGVVGE
ncbi:MAG: GDSL-type esterase/lipase family protein [Lachnospiraceae bacterium]|nr:GDSL-type esterase/lipase family protein [Lachnospiraceae bacterium]